MDDYQHGMAPAQELKWCADRILELYPIAEAEFQDAKNSLRIMKQAMKKQRTAKPEKCGYCGNPKVYAKGLCASCYGRLLRNGSPEYRRKVKDDEPQAVPVVPWCEKLRNSVLGSDYATPDDLEGSVLYLLDTLTDREKQSILLRYRDGKTLYDIGVEFGVTRERARQIIVKGERKLRHPSRKIYLELGLAKANETITENERIKKEAVERALNNKKLKYKIQQEHEGPGLDEADYSDAEIVDGIENLDIGVRAYNGLCRWNIKTIREWINFVGIPPEYEKLLKIRNLGRKSAEQIENALKAYLGEDGAINDTQAN